MLGQSPCPSLRYHFLGFEVLTAVTQGYYLLRRDTVFYSEDGGSTFPRNVFKHLDYMTSRPKR
jgi:hypothetical protein